MTETFYLLACRECGDPGRPLIMPFGTAAERGKWVCAACGVVHDRDINAAKVIRAAGLAVLACGDGVRPPRT